MAAENNGPGVDLPSAGDLNSFLEGSDQASATDTMAMTERAEQEQETETEETPEPQGDTFDRKYVEKLRRENASYRERAKKYETVFEGYEEGAVEEWKSLITNFRSDPKSVAEYMKDLSEQVLSQFTPAEQEEIAEAMADEEQPLTMSQLQQILDQRQQETELESMVRDIEKEATDLGYNLKSREYKILLMTAQELPSGSIQEAHELLESERQREFDKRIEELEKQGGGYRRPSSTVGVADNSKQIKSFKDAKDALDQHLQATFGK